MKGNIGRQILAQGKQELFTSITISHTGWSFKGRTVTI
jgi:hypothetical protein